ncbi:MAG: hypothetical protein DIZ80_15915 [endosymbiont of Galathealinum brachiosum]|uniref:Response regulatory domain-containing protein n=1 Tax=endosymbiont of Galathealinum brachiosum TaxID=2200906 RepID=A0A370D9J6_9GAMM|nr:MAG: hypothetical protein DIZ80_15915 [endosymbiont of Galathealinum brachiosum]
MTKNKSDYTVLSIDDSDILTALMKTLMEDEGYTFYSTESAAEAIKLINKHHFDIILMDIEMPGITGVELLKALNNKKLLQKTKVIMLTAKSDPDSISECIQLGAAGYILKPFQHDDIKTRVWKYLQEI